MGVCVYDGCFKQPHLGRVGLTGLWGWVRLHSSCAQVKLAKIITHTQR